MIFLQEYTDELIKDEILPEDQKEDFKVCDILFYFLILLYFLFQVSYIAGICESESPRKKNSTAQGIFEKTTIL